MEKITIAQLNLDLASALKDVSKFKNEIDALKKKQKELNTTTEEGQIAYAQTQVEIDKLNVSYRNSKQLATALVDTSEELADVMKVEGKSTQELYNSRSRLQVLSKNIKGNSEEEVDARNKLNASIDAQTQKIRGQSSEFLKGKDSIGEYANGFKEALAQINPFNGGIAGFAQRSKEAGGVGKLLTGSLNGMATSIAGVTKASLAFIATPIGAIIAAIVAVVLLVRNALDRSEESTQKLTKATSGIVGIFKAVLKVLEPVGDFLIDGIVFALDLATDSIIRTVELVAKGLKALGFSGAAKGVQDFANSLKEGVVASKELAEAQGKLDEMQRNSKKTQLDAQREAEKLRQLRDDETKSIPERIALNEQLGVILKKQLADELAIAEQAVKVAQLRIVADGRSKDALDAEAAALAEVADIKERITGQESEQLRNKISLQKEGAARAKEIAQSEIEALERNLETFKIINRKRLEDNISTLERQRDIELEINGQRYDKGLIDEAEFKANLIKIEAEFDDAKDAIKETELQKEADFQERKKELLNEIALANAEEELAKAELKLQQDFEKQQAELEQLELNETQKTELLTLLETQKQLALQGIQSDFAKKSKEADKKLFEEKKKQRLDDIANQEFIAQQATSILQSAFGENKAVATAATIVDTYFAAQKAYTSQLVAGDPSSLVRATLAAVASVAAGLARVSKIASAKFAHGGVLKGKSHADGGILTPFGELEGNEGVINKRSMAIPQARALASLANQMGGGVRFAATPSITNSQVQLIDYGKLAVAVMEGYRAAPPPVVAVEEINQVGKKMISAQDAGTI